MRARGFNRRFEPLKSTVRPIKIDGLQIGKINVRHRRHGRLGVDFFEYYVQIPSFNVAQTDS